MAKDDDREMPLEKITPESVITGRMRSLGLPRKDCVRIAKEAVHALEQAGFIMEGKRIDLLGPLDE